MSLGFLFGPATLEADPVRRDVSRPLLVAVAISSSGQSDGRWDRDLEAMRRYAEDHRMELLVERAVNNQMQQNVQAAKLLARKPDVLILTPHDAASAASIVKKARDQGVKVICYDRLVLNAESDLYVSFDDETAGELQARHLVQKAPRGRYVLLSGSPADYNSRLLMRGARKVLDPLIERGSITVAAEGPAIGWDSAEAAALVEKALDVSPDLAAVLAPNDGAAGGAAAVLAARGLAGKVAVSGQDATLEGARRVARGEQTMTVYKDTRQLGALVMALAFKMAAGEPWLEEAARRIEAGRYTIPAALLPVTPVDRDNLTSVLVGGGYYSYDEIYGRPDGSPE